MLKSVVLSVVCLVLGVAGHGRLWEPPSRSSLWRFGYDTPKNWNDNELFCGGARRQHGQNGGKCGICGDPWDGIRHNEAGGKYARGIISRRYDVGQNIDITIDVTANHIGWFEFNLCPVSHPLMRATDECMKRHPLELSDGSGTRWQLSSTLTGKFDISFRLPAGLQCAQCVLQWRWRTGNSWGTDPDTGRGCIGCGPQEEFRGCADISIGTTDEGAPSTDTPTRPAGGTSRRPTPPTTTRSPTTTTTTTTTTTRGSPSTTRRQTPTTPEATPTPRPTREGGNSCRAIGGWEGNPRLDRWCNDSCNHNPPHCPADRCHC